MATKEHELYGTDCFGDHMRVRISRNKDTVKVVTEHGDQFCCDYQDLARIVKAIEPKPKKKAEDAKPDA